LHRTLSGTVQNTPLPAKTNNFIITYKPFLNISHTYLLTLALNKTTNNFNKFLSLIFIAFIMTNKFFKDFKFLSQFFQRSEHEQALIEQQLQPFISEDEYQLAKFMGDDENISLLLIWIGKEFYKQTHKKLSLKMTLKSLNKQYSRVPKLDESGDNTIANQENTVMMTQERAYSTNTIPFDDVTRKPHQITNIRKDKPNLPPTQTIVDLNNAVQLNNQQDRVIDMDTSSTNSRLENHMTNVTNIIHRNT
jgi:hypothetical protein